MFCYALNPKKRFLGAVSVPYLKNDYSNSIDNKNNFTYKTYKLAIKIFENFLKTKT